MRVAMVMALGLSVVGCEHVDSVSTPEPVEVLRAQPTAQREAQPLGGGPVADEVLIPAGAFDMGCNEGEPSCVISALGSDPRHTVTLSSYYIDTKEVTQADYATCVTAGACTPPNTGRSYYDTSSDLPVVHVTWQQAVDYCTADGRRLPTEAEWERAARGTDKRVFPWGPEPADCDRAHFGTSCGGYARSVGTLPTGASPAGVLDMAGNVSEWIADWWDGSFYTTGPTTDPRGPGSGDARVFRGGSAYLSHHHLVTFKRSKADPTETTLNRGFRCARDGA